MGEVKIDYKEEIPRISHPIALYDLAGKGLSDENFTDALGALACPNKRTGVLKKSGFKEGKRDRWARLFGSPQHVTSHQPPAATRRLRFWTVALR